MSWMKILIFTLYAYCLLRESEVQTVIKFLKICSLPSITFHISYRRIKINRFPYQRAKINSFPYRRVRNGVNASQIWNPKFQWLLDYNFVIYNFIMRIIFRCKYNRHVYLTRNSMWILALISFKYCYSCWCRYTYLCYISNFE